MGKDRRIWIILAVLLVLTAIAAFVYLNGRQKVQAGSLVLVKAGKEQTINFADLTLEDFTAVVVNGKGEEKEISGKALPLATLTGTEDVHEVTVTADDAFSAVIFAEELERAWLLVEENAARLIVQGDENAKRDVKQVARIEVK